MKIINYLQKILKKSDEEIKYGDFNFSKFDKINIALTKQALDKSKNFWIHIDNNKLNKLYQTVIFASSVHFFENNYCEDEKDDPKKGQRYKNNKDKIFEVREVKHCDNRGRKIVILEGKSRGVSEKVTCRPNLSDLGKDYTKLSDEAANNNRTPVKPMSDFLKETLNIKEQIRSFPYKFAICCSKNEFKGSFEALEEKAFPYIHIADSGVETKNIELADSMFFVVSDYKTIQQYIFDKDIKLEAIVFIGNKYNHQIKQDIDRGHFKQAICIGEQKPDIEPILKWRWTEPEYQYLCDVPSSTIEPIKVENKVLTELREKFINNIKQLEQDNYIDLQSRILPYISYIFPLVVLAKDSRLKNGVDGLLHSFKEKSKRVLGEEFSNIGKGCTEFCQQLEIDYGVILEQFSFENNAKTHTLQQATETDYLLVPKGQTLAVWQMEIKKFNWQKTEIISFSQLKKLPSPKSITILSLMDYDFYRSIKDSRHTINWLLYDLEYELYQDFDKRYDNDLIAEYRSRDRKQLTGIDYPDDITPESADNLLYRIFDNKPPDDKEYQNSYQDHISKKVIFEDGSDVELSANSTLILINQHNEPEKCSVGDLRVGDKVRVYNNQHKEVLFDIAVDADKQGKFKEILDNAKLWKDILSQYCTDNDKIVEIANKCNIAENTVSKWLDSNSNTMFPQNLGSLQDICGNDYQKIFISRKKYNSIMIALGRDLSDEVSDYIISNEKGQLLSQFDDASIEAISEHNMPIRTIKEIDYIDRQAE